MGAHIINGRVILDGHCLQRCRSEVLHFEVGHECYQCEEPAIGHLGVSGHNAQTGNPAYLDFWLCSRHQRALLKRAPLR